MQMHHALADTILSFRLLKVGGLLVVDDVRAFAGVQQAMSAVIEALERENCVEVLHDEVRNATSMTTAALVWNRRADVAHIVYTFV